MSSISVAGDSSGSITIAAPAVAGSGTLTLPVATDTLAGIAATQTLTNKTLVAPALGTPASGNLVNCTGIPAASGSVIQVKTSTFDGYVSASVTGTVPTTITFGYQLFSLSFTPVSATSTILVQTSTVSAGETSNDCNQLWLALWDGSTFIAANSGTVSSSSFASNLNAGYYTLNNSYPSGSTSARTIQVRIGTDGGTQTIQINGNANGVLTGSSARIQMTVWEIAA